MLRADLIDAEYANKYSVENHPFDHLTSLPLSFFEKRHLGDIQSRFSSLDTIRSTFTNSIVSGIIDSIMTIGLLIMLTLYGGWLTWVVVGFTLCYAIMRPQLIISIVAWQKSRLLRGPFQLALYGVFVRYLDYQSAQS